MCDNFAVTKWELHDFHKMGFNGKDVVIAIIDSGIDSKRDAFDSDDKIHPDSRNFLEPQSDKDTTDGGGHGTHCAGCCCRPSCRRIPRRSGTQSSASVVSC